MTRRSWLGAALAAVVLLAGAAFLGYAVGHSRGFDSGQNTAPQPLPAVRPPSQLGVPDIVGEPLEAAADRLAGLEFQVGFRQPPSGKGTGVVERQVPEPGTIVERGSLVTLLEGRAGGE